MKPNLKLPLFQTLLSFLVIILLTTIIFRKFFFQGFLPIPYNILVGWYFPYILGGWPNYIPGIPFKGGLFAADVFRQMIPWKILSLDLLKSGQLPLWNPYAFSGEPLLANIQATIFYPLSILFFLIPNFNTAWSIYIILCPLLGASFMFLFLRSLKLNQRASLIGALAFGFSGRLLSWLEWGVITHSLIWLPLILFSLRYWLLSHKKTALPTLIFSLISTILGGYPQESAYVLLTSSIYFLFLYRSLKKLPSAFWSQLLLVIVSTSIFVAPQLIPTAKLYSLSALKGNVSKDLFLRSRMHPGQLLTAFAPDYFGNRITDNYWADALTSTDYMDTNLFIGTPAIIFVLLSLLTLSPSSSSVQKHQRFFTYLLFISLGLCLKSPLTSLLAQLRIPTLTTGTAVGINTVSVFSLCVLAAIGVSKSRLPSSFFSLIKTFFLYLLIFFSVFLVPTQFRRVTLRNLVIPGSIAIFSLFVLAVSHQPKLLSKFLPKPIIKLIPTITFFLLIFAAMAEYTLYAHKMLSFSPRDYFYPQHRLISKLQQLSQHDRIMGFWDSEIATNLPTQFRLYSAEGYNPLHLKSYQQLISAGETGHYSPDNLKRSDADFPVDNQFNRNRLLDLASIKYIAAKITDPSQDWEIEPLKYNPKRFKLIWQSGSFKIYENIHALPRVKLYNHFDAIPDLEERISRIYSLEWNPHHSLILSQPPFQPVEETATGSATITSYAPNQVTINTETKNGNMLLLLTDTHYSSWKAYINNQPTKIYPANHTFRAIVVPKGHNKIVFKAHYP